MIRRPPRSTLSSSSAASDVYKRQFEDLAAPDALSVLGRAPNPDRAAKLTRGQLVAALRTARRHHVEAKAGALLTVLRTPALRQPATLQGAYAAVVLGQVGIITALNE